MANLTQPDEIMMNFLRSNVEEITRVSLSNRQSSLSEDFSGDNSTTAFIVSSKMVCSNDIIVDGSTLVAYIDYQIDLDNKTITFTTAPSVGVDNITINYDTGDNWIFPDLPRDDLAEEKYPRIGIIVLTETGDLQGLAQDDTFDNVSFQFDCVGFKDQPCTGNSENIQDNDVAQLLARRVRSAIKNNWRTKLQGAFFNPSYTGNNPVPFDDSNFLYRFVVSVSMDALNVGE